MPRNYLNPLQEAYYYVFRIDYRQKLFHKRSGLKKVYGGGFI